MCPNSWRATVSTSKAPGTAPIRHACSESSKWTGFGRVLVMTPQAGGKSAWARMPPIIE